MKLFTFLFLLLSSVCVAQPFSFNQGGPTTKNYYEEIPYENVYGKIIVEGEIAGKRHRFLFDTGAPVAISKELAAELNAAIMSKISIADTFLHKDSSAVVELNDLKLGGITFNHIPAITLFPDFYKCYHIDGVIGSNLLRNSIVSIVGSKHLIVFTDQKKKLDLKSKNSAPMVTNVGYQSDPKISMLMNGKVNLSIAFDTGDSQFLRMSDKLVTMLQKYALFDTLSTGYGASGRGLMGLEKDADKCLLHVADFTIGNGRFTNLITISNNEAIPAIGSKLLDYGTVTLDFINSKFYFDATVTANDLTEKQLPLRPVFANDKLVVGVVWQKGKGLVKLGEQILAVDDTDYSRVTLCDLINGPPVADGKDTAVFTLKDAAGNTRKVTITKE